MKSLAVLSLLCVGACALAQKAPSIVGTWVADAASIKDNPMSKDVSVTFMKDMTLSLKGFHTVGQGTYTVQGTVVTITLTKRNGVKPTNPTETTGKLTIAEGGKALLLDVGHSRNGQSLMTRLVRKSSR